LVNSTSNYPYIGLNPHLFGGIDKGTKGPERGDGRGLRWVCPPQFGGQGHSPEKMKFYVQIGTFWCSFGVVCIGQQCQAKISEGAKRYTRPTRPIFYWERAIDQL